MRKIAFLMILVLTVTMLAGCGGSGGNGVEGTYELTSMKEGDMAMSGEELKAFATLMGVDGPLIIMELSSGGKAKVTSTVMEEVAGEGTYTLEGNKITVTIADAPISGTVDGKKITLADDDLEMVFEKK